jgi:hypothetical protein
MRILPDIVAKISCPFSNFTLNMALLIASIITPSCLISGCFDILILGLQRYGNEWNYEKFTPKYCEMCKIKGERAVLL